MLRQLLGIRYVSAGSARVQNRLRGIFLDSGLFLVAVSVSDICGSCKRVCFFRNHAAS